MAERPLTDHRPLGDYRIVDFGTGRSAALLTRMLGDLGGRIDRYEPQGGDPFYASIAAYDAWQADKTITHAPDIETAVADAALETADICIVGGDDFPGLRWRPDTAALARAYPRLIVVAIGEFDPAWPAHDLLVQARLGLVFEQHADRPAVMGFPAAAYGAALEAALGLAAALCARVRDGGGQVVSTSLANGAMTWLRQAWFAFAEPPKVHTGQTPKGVRPLIFRCADHRYIHFVLGAINARRHVFTILNIADPVPSLDEDPHGLPSAARGVRDFLGDIDLIQRHVARWDRDDLLRALWAAGVAAEAVNEPGVGWDDAQVAHNRLLVEDDVGRTRIGLPFEIRSHEGSPTSATAAEASPRPPLVGIRILDFGSYTAGPHASMLLADLGADVIKVESLQGDPMRGFFQIFAGSGRGKRSIALDLKSPAGREVALRLCASADMMHHNLRPGVTARLGLDEAAVRAVNPGIILLENAGYGLTGPKASQGGFDMIFQAFCGHEMLAAGEGNPPENAILPTIDLAAGLLGAIGSAFALLARLRFGQAGSVETSLLNAGLYLLADLVKDADGHFTALPRLDRRQLGFGPAERLYQARDGWVAIVIPDDAMAGRLAAALNLNHVLGKDRRQWGDAEATAIEGAVAPLPMVVLLRRLRDADVWACAADPEARPRILADPDRRRDGSVVETTDARVGKAAFPGRLYALSRSPTQASGRVCALGGDTRRLLAEVGYDETAIDALYRDRVVG